MKLALFAYSRRACATAEAIRGCFPEAEVRAFAPEKYLHPGFCKTEAPSVPFYGQLFAWADAMIFVSSCGIAVRQIAPHVKDKTTDPAVLCVDELGHFVIPLLSGHIGGANALANSLAKQLRATAVVTTATDINQRFSADAWAAAQGLVMDDRKAAKAVSAGILEADLPLLCRFPVLDSYPPGTFPGNQGKLGICISYAAEKPFDITLSLIPRILHLGIGCRKGTSTQAIEAAVEKVMREHRLDPRALKCAASVDLKAQEEGLLAYCRERELPVRFYSAQELMTLEGTFSQSQFVRQIAGVDCVCERSAMMGADRLIVKKTAENGVTVAIAAERYEVRFG